MIHKEIVNQAIDYILNHINEDITLDEIAEYCNFSKYYFSRVFKAETGESVYAFIKRIKMEQSAFRLKVEKDRSVTDIGLEYGYSSSNYSSAFKEHHKMAPVTFRKEIKKTSLEHPFFHKTVDALESFEECNRKISIENVENMFVLYERRIGNYNNLGEEWCEFIDKYQSYYTKDTVLIERTFDDPSITDYENCLYDICMTVDRDCPLENTYVIEGGKFAVYHFSGYPPQIYAAYQGIFNVWFPQKHSVLDERYGFDIYRTIDNETSFMTIDFYIPIR